MLKFISSKVLNYCTKATSPPVMSQVKAVRKARYDGRTKKRKWEDRRTDKGESLDLKKSRTAHTPDSKDGSIVDKIKRKKYVLLMGYSGVDYFGMQRNPGTKTIEEELFKALRKCDVINDECFTQVQNMQFQRAARTDKGVSAARQVVSLKIYEIKSDFDFLQSYSTAETVDIIKINEHLPEVIRVFGIKRVTKGFNSKTQCDGRTYFYMFPTAAFAPSLEDLKQKEFRLDKETLERVNNVLGMFVGTKNFHNFTAKKKPSDPSNTRFIKSFICEEPFIRKDNEFAVIKVRGQSFMLHQIRKMVGLTIAIVRNQASEEVLNRAFSLERIAIPRAPGLGLVLDYVHYDRYNYRYGEDGMHEKLTWDEVDKEVNEFKEKFIYPTIIDTEINEKSMITWIENKLCRHTYDTLIDDRNDESDVEDNNEDDDNGDDTGSSADIEQKENNVSDEKVSEEKAEEIKSAVG